VDLNRNYSPGWDLVTDRTAPSSTFYKGEYAGSEVEAQALMNVVNSLSNPRMAISYHSYGDLVYWQYGQSEPLWSANQNLATAISNLTGHYLAGYSNEAGFSNWCVLEKGIPSVTVETGTVPAPLPIDQFALLWSQHQYTWVMLGTYE
jgi:g-D-glutamyl-meso-diaminopimelate peptidase